MKYFNKKDLKICTLNINSTIKEVITNLNKSSLQITIINSSDGYLLGVITDGDIRRGLLRGLDLNSKISSLIKKNPIILFFKELFMNISPKPEIVTINL